MTPPAFPAAMPAFDPSGKDLQGLFERVGELDSADAASLDYQIRRPPEEILFFSLPTGEITWANMPSAVTEFLGDATARFRTQVDLTNRHSITVFLSEGSATGASGARVGIQYSTDLINWSSLDGTPNDIGPYRTLSSINSAARGVTVGLAPGAKQLVWIRLAGKSGDGAADPTFRRVALQFA